MLEVTSAKQTALVKLIPVKGHPSELLLVIHSDNADVTETNIKVWHRCCSQQLILQWLALIKVTMIQIFTLKTATLKSLLKEDNFIRPFWLSNTVMYMLYAERIACKLHPRP